MGIILAWLDGYMSAKSGKNITSNESMEKFGRPIGLYCGWPPATPLGDAIQGVSK